ncbi:MAG: DegV family protein [Mycobacteriales bacterium]
MSGADSQSVAVVTDSTSYLPAGVAESGGIRVVPLHVLIGGRSGAEGADVTPQDVANALLDRHTKVTTSRPTPADFTAAYDEALAAGATAIVSIHMSAELSGTFQSASLAAEDCPAPVRVLDSRSTAMGLGFAVMAAADAAAAGRSVDDVYTAAQECCERTTMLFFVDTLEYLRRGGRIGATTALLGTALSVKPILHVADGSIVLLEKVRTGARGMTRLADLAVQAAGDGPVDVAVHFLGRDDRAAELSDRLKARLPHLQRMLVSELGAAVGAHVGPGVVGAVVVRRE